MPNVRPPEPLPLLEPASDDPATRRKQRWIEVGLVVAVWSFLAILVATSRILDPRFGSLGNMDTAHVVLEVVHTFGFYYVWALLTPGIFWMARHFGLERPTWRTRIPLYLGVGLVIAIAVDLYDDYTRAELLGAYMRRPYTFDPLRDIMRLWFLNEFIIYFAVLATAFARDYFLRYRDRVQEAERLRAALAEARLETLRMQLNPHFLFNTLHAVSSLVERDPRGVRRMIARLSTLLRYTLDGTHAQEVPLQQELAFLRDYLDIQQIRFQGRLEVTEDVAADVQDALVPNLILQPIVENALKHGVSQAQGPGLVELRAWRAGGRLHVSVRDNGPGLDGFSDPGGDGVGGDGLAGEASSSGVGLRNTHARLRGLYGDDQSLTFQPAEGGGLVVALSLPYHTAADLHTTAV